MASHGAPGNGFVESAGGRKVARLPVVELEFRGNAKWGGLPLVDFEDGKRPSGIFVTDTTFRDGQQSLKPYSAEQVLGLFKLLRKLDNGSGAIRQSEFFLYHERDRKAVEKCLAEGSGFPEVTGWIRANAKDFELVRKMGLKETGILTSISDYHIFSKMKLTRAGAIAAYMGVVDAALSNGIIPRCHFEDVTRAELYEVVVPFAQHLMARAEQAKLPVRIRLCDTVGEGMPFKEVAGPRSIPNLVRALIQDAGVPGAWLEFHGHMDRMLDIANGVSAWLAGCASVNGALVGFGERVGNSMLEVFAQLYSEISGDKRLDFKVIPEMRAFFQENIGVRVSERIPFGENAFRTSAGIHAAAMLDGNDEMTASNPLSTYFSFHPVTAGGKPGVFINQASGHGGVALWIQQHLCNDAGAIGKSDPRVERIWQAILAEYDEGRVTVISDQEMASHCEREGIQAVV